MTTSELNCLHCGTSFERKKKFCDETCKNRYASNKRSEQNKDKQLKVKNINCTECNIEFIPERKNAKFCSKECGKKYANRKNSEKEQHERMKTPELFASCSICGFLSNNLQNHITNTHNITLGEYSEKYPNSRIYSDNYIKDSSERIKGENNPAFGHDGKFSPFSKNFVKYENLSDVEKQEKIQSIQEKTQNSIKENDSCSLTVQYWINKGNTEEEAKEIISKRQRTFSLDICIEKYGPEEGKRIWIERQNKWNNNFKKSNYSKISQEVFWELYEKIKCDYHQIYFAELDQTTKSKDINGKNNEIAICGVKPDFIILDINKIIEFDGDYWHSEARGNQQRDRDRDNMLAESGYKVYRIKERDYKKDKKGTLEKCLNFLRS